MMASNTTRRPRLRDAETERRMLDAALERVREHGLHVSFDQLGYEELITAAGVARSTVYRRWPSRDDFHRTLLLELLAEQVDLVQGFSPEEKFELVRATIGDSPLLATPEGRRMVMVEMSRQLVTSYLETMMSSSRHRAHDTLVAVVDGDEVGLEKLRQAQQDLLDRVASFHDAANRMLRMRWVDGVTSTQAAALGSALLRGFVRATPTFPADVVGTRLADPFDVGTSRPWGTVATGYTAMIMSLLEPDPDTTDPESRA